MIAIQKRIVCGSVFLLQLTMGLAGEPLSPADANKWMDHLTPLPREISIPARLQLKPGEIAVRGITNASAIVEQAVHEMSQLVKASPTAAHDAKFKITFQLGGSEAESLKSLKNSDQAYRILPEDGDHGLRLVALAERGLCYAGKTLQQLLRARLTAERIEMPLALVKDWPEMETRGLWGSDSFNWLPWLAERKLNYQENISRLWVDQKTRRGHASVKSGTEQLLTLGPRLGIEHAPVVLHLEQLEGTGLFEAYPNLKGTNGGKPGVICYSQPEFVGVLADWISELGSQPTVRQVDVWFTENLNDKGGCQCRQCARENWVLAEARTVIAAWKEARQGQPGLGLRVLTSEATRKDNAALFAAIPREVGIWYYDSLLTYTTRKANMIHGPVFNQAQSGHWVGVCPNLVARIGWAQPFTGPQFIHARMTEFTSKGLQGMIGYATPRTVIGRFNIEAAMEWLWHPAGRSPREFARTWAVREKIRDPKKFAAWTELVGPVSWAIYGSEWPAGDLRRAVSSVAPRLAKAELPELGEFKWGIFGSPWGDIKTPAELAANVAATARGLKLAREIGAEEFIQETLVIQAYAESLLALWELKQIVTPNGIAPDQRAAAREQFLRYDRALQAARTALPMWEEVVLAGASQRGFTKSAVETLTSMARDMKTTAGQLGVNY